LFHFTKKRIETHICICFYDPINCECLLSNWSNNLFYLLIRNKYKQGEKNWWRIEVFFNQGQFNYFGFELSGMYNLNPEIIINFQRE